MREQRHPRSRLRRFVSWIPEVVVVLLVAAAAANLAFDLDERWFGLDHADARKQPAEVLPPAGLDLVAGSPAPAVAESSPGGELSADAVRQALTAYVSDPSLGGHVDVAVGDLAGGGTVFRSGAGAVTPASTTKLLTATAALEELGPMARFRTTVRQEGRGVVLVGGGDPFLASTRAAAKGLYPARATLDDLAARTATALTGQGLRKVRLSYDASMFTGPSVDPAWPASYLSDDVVPPITALWADEGKGPDGRYVADPAAAAAGEFADALAAHGVAVRGTPQPETSTAADKEIAAVESAPLGQIVERTLAVSDNNAAEVLAHHVGIAVQKEGSFAAGVAGVLHVLDGLGVDTAGDSLYDGSGLSRRDRLSPDTLLDVLRVAASSDHPKLRDVLTGLPVAGFTGSLQWRFDDAPASARGRVRAKTGTLTGVSGLAGIVTDLDGNRIAFVAIADRIDPPQTLAARRALDLIAAALAGCHCGQAGPTAGPTS